MISNKNKKMSTLFERNVIQVWGDKGRLWLESLPSTINALTKKWDLTQLTAVEVLSFNYVMAGYQSSNPIILKIGCDPENLLKELTALKAYAGNNCIHLLDNDTEYNALLLEQAFPGTSLVPLFPEHDDTALQHVTTIMNILHTAPLPPQGSLPTLEEFIQDLYKQHPALNSTHIKKAQLLAQQLLATQTNHVVLHGDMHHSNILLSNRGWLAIDPKGIVGDPAYEVCAFIRNPNPELLKPIKLINHRLNLFAEHLSINKQRLLDWVYVQAVLDGCWALLDGSKNSDTAWAEADLITSIYEHPYGAL